MSLAAVLAAGGCMVGPDYTPPATTMPAAYDELTNGSDDGTGLRHRRCAPPKSAGGGSWVMTGSRAWSSVQCTANHGVVVAQARLREARAGRQMAQAMLYPQIGVGAPVAAIPAERIGRQPPGVNASDGLSFKSASMPHGPWTCSAEFAEERKRPKRTSRRATRSDEASSRWSPPRRPALPELRGAQRELTIAVTTLDEQRQTLAVTENKNRNGLASDLKCCGRERKWKLPRKSRCSSKRAGSTSTSSTLLGQGADRAQSRTGATTTDTRSARMLAVGIPSISCVVVRTSRPPSDNSAAATAGVGVASARSLSPVAPRRCCRPSRNSGICSTGDSKYYVAGPSINWNPSTAGFAMRGVGSAKRAWIAARAAYEDTVLRAFREVESSLVAVDRTQEQVRDLNGCRPALARARRSPGAITSEAFSIN
jgi:hypothetical protein